MDTRRPTNPAAEEILGGYFPVLDHGFVALIDYMGGDESVERAARVSYGFGTRARSQTRGLIRYLRRHLHTTPSEMVELMFHCAMPMFVARQWVRHRTACLTGDTQVCFDLPAGARKRSARLYKLTLAELWQRFQPTQNRTRPDKQRDPYYRRDRVKAMHLRHLDEERGRIAHTRVVDVFRNGFKPVFRMTLADGKSIECTAEHRFLFADGWRTLREATGVEERNGIAVWDSGDQYVYVNGSESVVPALYRDARWLRREYVENGRYIADLAEQCGCSYHTIRKWIGRYGLQQPGRGDFKPGARPWNKARRYRLGPRQLTPAWRSANRKARAGSASNFWRGGVTAGRDSIGRWTTQRAGAVHRRHHWTCQLCGQGHPELHCHHVVPIWADPSRAKDTTNLTTLCGPCHRAISGRELEFVERLGGPPVKAEWTPRPRTAWNRVTRPRLVRIDRLEYVGRRETFDLEVEGPSHNYVANGIVTHNSINEYSARYSLLPLLFYSPAPEHFSLQSSDNKQGRQAEAAAAELHGQAVRRWETIRKEAGDTYGWLVENDVAREIARIDLPVSTYTQWYWKIDLHNLLHFLTLRIDPHAQYEIRAYAEVIAGMVKRVAPLSYEAWVDYGLGAAALSRMERAALARLAQADGEGGLAASDGVRLSEGDLKDLGLSARERRELAAKLVEPPSRDFELDLSRMRDAAVIEEEMRRAVPAVDLSD
ncbi:MAG TPA: FAD-dependent thymidylate synthase [Longimicrobiales bacterium]|nr:FAD-dependent thymidylate synthase [Longimicrobiales bacterium]